MYQIQFPSPDIFSILLLQHPMMTLHLIAFSLIWRTRSRVKPNLSPISSNVISCCPIPKNICMISFSLSVNVESALSISLARDSFTKERSAIGESSFTNTSSKLLSSPSTKGASTEMWRPDTFSVSEILSTGISSSSANS